MKTYIKIIAIVILSAFAFTAGEQNDRRHTGTPFISKDVVIFSNKNIMETPRLTVRSFGNPDQIIFKDMLKQRDDMKGAGAEAMWFQRVILSG